MRKDRLIHSVRLLLIRNITKRTQYVKKHKILGGIGEGCVWGPWRVPLYPKLIKLHNNVCVHKTAILIPHDYMNDFFRPYGTYWMHRING